MIKTASNAGSKITPINFFFTFFPIIGLSVEMLATVGETIGEENPDIRGDMQEACRESRNVSSGLEKLCESLSHTVIGKND